MQTNKKLIIAIDGPGAAGKSTVAKHLILNEFMTGTKLVMIDVEREYKELTEMLK